MAEEVSALALTFEGRSVRIFTRAGEPWFVLADVCRVLGMSNPTMAAARLDNEEKSTLSQAEGAHINGLAPGGSLPTIINEPGLYRLVMRSDKPEARRFQKWVAGEVLPAIRKTGGYMVAAPDETPEQLALRAMQVLQATIERQKAALAVAQPKVDGFDRIAEASGSFCVREAAKSLQVNPTVLSACLRDWHWVYRTSPKSDWLAYQDKIDSGHLIHKVSTGTSYGTPWARTQVRITPKGLARLTALFAAPMAA